MGSTNVITHSINTGDSPLIKQHARHIPFVDGMKKRKVVQSSKSPWASSVVLVAKRMVIKGFVGTTED